MLQNRLVFSVWFGWLASDYKWNVRDTHSLSPHKLQERSPQVLSLGWSNNWETHPFISRLFGPFVLEKSGGGYRGQKHHERLLSSLPTDNKTDFTKERENFVRRIAYLSSKNKKLDRWIVGSNWDNQNKKFSDFNFLLQFPRLSNNWCIFSSCDIAKKKILAFKHTHKTFIEILI